MGKIHQMVNPEDRTERFYPRTLEEAVVDLSGSSLSSKLESTQRVFSEVPANPKEGDILITPASSSSVALRQDVSVAPPIQLQFTFNLTSAQLSSISDEAYNNRWDYICPITVNGDTWDGAQLGDFYIINNGGNLGLRYGDPDSGPIVPTDGTPFTVDIPATVPNMIPETAVETVQIYPMSDTMRNNMQVTAGTSGQNKEYLDGAWVDRMSAADIFGTVNTAISTVPTSSWRTGAGSGSAILYMNEANYNVANGSQAVAHGQRATASGAHSHAEGTETYASGSGAHAEGRQVRALGECSHAEGGFTTASGMYSHAEGYGTRTSGSWSHAEGQYTVASGTGSHAEGSKSLASGTSSHAEGQYTSASGQGAHAEGSMSVASGTSSHAEGQSTIASNSYEHAQGKYNATASSQIFSIGVGDAAARRKNAISIITGSKTVPSASVYVYGVGGYNGTNPTPGTNDLATIISSLTGSQGGLTSESDPFFAAKSASLEASASLAATAIQPSVTSSWATAAANSHTHDNKTVLDNITAAKTASWDGKQDTITDLAAIRASASLAGTNGAWITSNSGSIHTHTNKTVLDGITAAKTASWEASGTLAKNLTAISASLIASGTLAKNVTAITASLVASASVAKTASSSAAAISAKTGSWDALVGLPAVTAADNGKILRVVNGAWALVDPVTIYSGQGTPAQNLGTDGDIYLQS